MTFCGIVAVAGKPNVGKSTLLNRIIGQKLSITSPKPQSTRDQVVGILTDGDTQMVIVDTPGLLEPKYELQKAMRSAAVAAINDADVVVYLADAIEGAPPPLAEAAGLKGFPQSKIITVLNKAEMLPEDRRQALVEQVPAAKLISAKTGDGIQELLAAIREVLPESPFLYPEEDVSSQSMRFFVTELIRETALEQLGEEVPYSIACEIEEFREDRSPIYIRAVIYVERDSQKRILVGGKGARIRELGTASRQKIEKLVGEKVYLDLWVKVLANWRSNSTALQRFGYKVLETGKR